MSRTVNISVLPTIGVILSAMIYGSIVSLTLTYVPLLMKTSHTMSRFMRNFLLVYVAVMTTISTGFMITSMLPIPSFFKSQTLTDYVNAVAFIPTTSDPYELTGNICLVLVSWGADGFMLWRCAILYYGVSKYGRWAVITILVILGLATVVMGLISFILGSAYAFGFICILIVLNIVTAALITFRMLYYQRYIQETVGLQHGDTRLYTKIIMICVESSALIVICNMIYVILAIINSPYVLVVMELMVNVYVISPLLIVYRVAMGKAVVAIPEGLSGGATRPVSVLQFHPQSTTPSSDRV